MYMIRKSVVIFVLVGIMLLLVAMGSDHRLAGGWGPQTLMNLGTAVMGIALVYGVVRGFAHIRTHQIKNDPDSVSWKHIVFACTIIWSCAYVIGSAIQ